MSNSVLSLAFPLSGEVCLHSDPDMQQQPFVNVKIPLHRKRLFTKELKNKPKFGLILTSGKTEDEIIYHQRRLLFQAGITAAASGKKVLCITPKPWKEVPFPANGCGVHRMPKWNEDILSQFTFIYPTDCFELLKYVAAVGGLEKGCDEIPDVLLVENLEQFFSPGPTYTKMVKEMKRFLAQLKYLSNVIADWKPFDVLVTAGRKEYFPKIKKYYSMVDEIWETARISEDDEFTLTLVGQKSPFRYVLIFLVNLDNKAIYFRSLLKESKSADEPLSPIL